MPVYKDKNKHWYFIVTINYKQYKRVKYNGKYMLSKAEALAYEQEFIKSINGLFKHCNCIEYINFRKFFRNDIYDY